MSFKDSVVRLFIYVPTCLTGKYEDSLGEKAHFKSTYVDLSEKLYTTSKKMGTTAKSRIFCVYNAYGAVYHVPFIYF